MRIYKKSNKLLVIVLLVLLISFAVALWFKFETVLSPVKVNYMPLDTKKDEVIIQSSVKKQIIPSFYKNLYSRTEPSSIWVVVNKQNPLKTPTYIPSDLIVTNGATIRDTAKNDFELMISDAAKQSISLNVISSYRSYYNQSAIYNNYTSIYGQAMTDTFSARPGHSEHQIGLAIDFGNSDGTSCNLDNCFGTTTAGKWLSSNSNEYGFILRYPYDKQSVTGYKYEPWHFRYVGRVLSKEMKKQGINTLEEFFDIKGGEIYI